MPKDTKPSGTAAHLTFQQQAYPVLASDPADGTGFPNSSKKTFGATKLKNAPSPLTVMGGLDTTYRGKAIDRLTPAEVRDFRLEVARREKPAAAKVGLTGEENLEHYHRPTGAFDNAQVLLRLSYLENALHGSIETVETTTREIELLKHQRATLKALRILDKPPIERTPDQRDYVQKLVARSSHDSHRLGACNAVGGDKLLPSGSAASPFTPTASLADALVVGSQHVRTGKKRLAGTSHVRAPPFALVDSDKEASYVRVVEPLQRAEPLDAVEQFALRTFAEVRRDATNGESLQNTRHLNPVVKRTQEIRDKIEKSKARFTPTL